MWSLKIIQGAELADKPVLEMRLPMPLQRFSIGRDPGNPWAITDRTLALSARHCEIVASPAGPLLRDLSTNGSFVNGSITRMAGDHLLRDGDRIEIGPFVIAVSGPPMPARVAVPAAPALASAALPRTPGVMETAPHRGGDPAAMLAAGAAGAPVGLTEILRVATPVQHSGEDMTKIRLAPPPRAAAPSAAPARPPAEAAEPAVVIAASLANALARGLGVPASALADQDLLLLAERVARSAEGSIGAEILARHLKGPP